MSRPLPWRERKKKLWNLLNLSISPNVADEEGRGIDRLVLSKQEHAQSTELDNLRFTNRDLSNFGALAHGPFGTVDMVRCRLDNRLYVRKSVEKRVVARNASQCYPYHEKELLLAATRLNSTWTPHLLCTFQNSTHLCYVMQFAEGGSLGDLLESTGQIPERDVKWWLPQMIVAIDWCHSEGFCHRDIKPSNFVVTSSGRLQIIDFASSARLLPPMEDGVQLIPKESCLVLCGTCDYISPEILAMQEAALVALDEEDEIFVPKGEGGYGRETDWWSLGATIYELIYGVAPFFAKDIRGTYELIMNHERNLRFPAGTDVSSSCVSFLSGLLRTATKRLGRHNIHELTSHKLFSGIDWSNLTKRTPPNDLHVPQFEYDIPEHSIPDFSQEEESYSKGYAFSAFFNSSVSSTSTNPNAGNVTFVRPPSPRLNAQQQESDFDVPPHLAQYVGFTWGPSLDAFDGPITSPKGPSVLPTRPSNVLQTPVPTSKQSRTEAYQQGLRALESLGSGSSALPSHQLSSLPHRGPSALVTPVRPASSSYYGTLNVPPSTIRRAAGGTARKTGSVRTMSEVEQLKQLSDCVRASARKRLSDHAGRTPGPAGSAGTSTAIGGGGARAFGRAAGRKSWDVSDGGASNSFASEHAPLRRRASWVKMTLDFENVGEPVARAKRDGANSGQRVGFVGYDEDGGNDVDQPSGLRIFVKDRQQRRSGNNSNRNSLAMSLKSEKDYAEYGTRVHEEDESTGGILFGTVNSSRPRSQQRARTSARDSDTSFTTTDEEPPSPSPSPRPGSGLLRPSSRKGGATLSSRPSFGTLPRQGPSFRQHGHSASISTLNLAEQIPLTHSAPGSLQERAKPKRTSIGSIFMRPASTSGKSSGSGQEEERAKESWNDPLGLGTSSAQMRQEEETEETPRARRQYSSSIGAMDARATSQLRVPIFTRRQTSKQSLDQELTKKNEVVDPFGGEASQLQPQVHSQDDPLVAGPTTETTSKDPNSVGETYPDVSEMEERLRKMMNDLQKVEGGLKAVRARLKA